MSTEERLSELSEGWQVTLQTVSCGWRLVLVHPHDGRPHVYKGESLARVVARAHAGAPCDP